MNTTAQRVFELAMGLIDEVNEQSGQADTGDTRDYKQRTLYILNALRGELAPYTGQGGQGPGQRPGCPVISDFDSVIGLDDTLTQSVLPFGLAAALLAEENPQLAAYFQQRYSQLLQKLGPMLPRAFQPVENCYRGIEHGRFARRG